MSGTPERVGHYTIADKLGEGGMGEVFLAYSPAGDEVAVKLIRADRLDPQMRARFEKEARVARDAVGTSRVARFLDADPYTERPWMAMEYVPGRTLEHEVDDRGPLAPVLVASLGALLAEGLSAVHAAELLHRDLKPQNVMLGEYGPVIIDFGLAAFADATKGSLSDGSTIIGSVRCIPPEQAAGQTRVTTAADVYGLGTVLLYAATGHYPYDGTGWEVIVAQVKDPDEAPDLTGVPQEVLPLLRSMLAHAATDRPNLGQVASACTELMTALGVAPVAARRELLARSRSDRVVHRGGEGMPVEVEDRVRQRLAEQQGMVEPAALDSANQPPAEAPVAEPGSDEPVPDEPVEEQQQRPGRAAAAKRRPRPARPREPAHLRIAKELEQAYAWRTSL